jgi:hypothetical protein
MPAAGEEKLMPQEFRYDEYGKITVMASSGQWLMVRRPHCAPFVMRREYFVLLSTSPMVPAPRIEDPELEAAQQAEPLARFRGKA